MTALKIVLSLFALIATSVGAYYWYRSATVAPPAHPETPEGMGAFPGGFLVSVNERGERIDLHSTIFWQSKFNKNAALWTAAGIGLSAISQLLQQWPTP